MRLQFFVFRTGKITFAASCAALLIFCGYAAVMWKNGALFAALDRREGRPLQCCALLRQNTRCAVQRCAFLCVLFSAGHSLRGGLPSLLPIDGASSFHHHRCAVVARRLAAAHVPFLQRTTDELSRHRAAAAAAGGGGGVGEAREPSYSLARSALSTAA